MSKFDVIIPEGQQILYDRFHYAPAVRDGDRLYCSGVLGTGPDGKVPAELEAQITQAFENLKVVLAAAGASFEDVFEVSTFHMDMASEMGTFVKVKDRYLTEPYPAWTAVGVSQLAFPGARIEIKAIAHLHEGPPIN